MSKVKRRVLSALGVTVAGAALAVGSGLGSPAHASPQSGHAAAKPAFTAGDWEDAYLEAESGGGCVSYLGDDAHLLQLVNWPCNDGPTEWEFRTINAGLTGATAETEWVTTDFKYAIGLSGGHWKLETPADPDTAHPTILTSNFFVNESFDYDEYATSLSSPYGQDLMGPSAKAAPLVVATTLPVPPNGWHACIGTSPTNCS